MDLGRTILSDFNIFDKYAKYLPALKRRETWQEICTRYEDMMIKKYPQLSSAIVTNMGMIRDKKILPSMRALQFAGPAIDKTPSRIYNCGYLPVDSVHAFSETLFLLLSGVGIGFSVQFHHVEKLPEIVRPTKKRRFLIGDSIEGWSDAVKVLMKAYFGNGTLPIFDFSDIRSKGTRLVTSGGKAPGPEPLKECLFEIQKILDRKQNGEKLRPIECHDIMCYIAHSVLSGGVRRAALISLFSFDDEEMLACKAGNWWELNPQRGRANNSVVILRSRIKREDFDSLWRKIRASGAGEPGIYFTNNIDWGTNPCCEIGLRPFQFCNLCDVNVSNLESEADFLERCEKAAFFGTLQAGFTDFHYLRPIWQRNTEKDALIGVGMTGIASGTVMPFDLESAAERIKTVNRAISESIGIHSAARTTCVKPSGTTSCVLGTSSGIHAWYSDYYIRRCEMHGQNPVAKYLLDNQLHMIKPLERLPGSWAIELPIKAPENAITRHNETAQTLLDRVKDISTRWVQPGHINGDNTNNVSVTIFIKEDEWNIVRDWLWDNRKSFNGAAILPHDNGTYIEAPHEDITPEEYEKRIKLLQMIDFTKIKEEDDETHFTQEVACATGYC